MNDEKLSIICIFLFMKPVKYDKLYEELLEEYPIEENPEIYSLYTSMLNHLMKVFKLKHSTAVKLLLKVDLLTGKLIQAEYNDKMFKLLGNAMNSVNFGI